MDFLKQPEAGTPDVREPAGPAQSGYISFVAVHQHSAAGTHGVLMLSPWGIEELCARKAYRCLGERLAGSGYPVMRFDFPGTADARAWSASETWLAAAQLVLDRFAEINHLVSVTLVAQGAGALVAARLASENTLVAGTVLMAPVSGGRFYLREIAAWSSLMKDIYRDGCVKGDDGSLRAAGFTLSPQIQGELKTFTPEQDLVAAGKPVLLLQRPNHPGDGNLADRFTEAGLELTCLAFDEYAGYVGDPTLSELPERALCAAIDWISKRHPLQSTRSAPGAGAPAEPAPSLTVSTAPDTVMEEPIRFSGNQVCFGVVTAPAAGGSGTGFIFLNSGYDHHVGWGGCHVELARGLAGDGHTSLRVDASGIGEAGLHDGQDPQILYSQDQVPDVTAAVDVLRDRGLQRIVVVGRCSGAYLAFLAAGADDRISAVVLVNTRRFAWDPRQVVDEEIRKPVQPLQNYRRKLKDWATIRQAMSSPASFLDASGKLFRGLSRPLRRAAEKRLGRLTVSGRLVRLVHERMRRISQRGSRVLIVFGTDDMGRTELDHYFGPAGETLSGYPGARVDFIANTDHNLTSQAARNALLSKLRETADLLDGRDA